MWPLIDGRRIPSIRRILQIQCTVKEDAWMSFNSTLHESPAHAAKWTFATLFSVTAGTAELQALATSGWIQKPHVPSWCPSPPPTHTHSTRGVTRYSLQSGNDSAPCFPTPALCDQRSSMCIDLLPPLSPSIPSWNLPPPASSLNQFCYVQHSSQQAGCREKKKRQRNI